MCSDRAEHEMLGLKVFEESTLGETRFFADGGRGEGCHTSFNQEFLGCIQELETGLVFTLLLRASGAILHVSGIVIHLVSDKSLFKLMKKIDVLVV